MSGSHNINEAPPPDLTEKWSQAKEILRLTADNEALRVKYAEIRQAIRFPHDCKHELEDAALCDECRFEWEKRIAAVLKQDNPGQALLARLANAEEELRSARESLQGEVTTDKVDVGIESLIAQRDSWEARLKALEAVPKYVMHHNDILQNSPAHFSELTTLAREALAACGEEGK